MKRKNVGGDSFMVVSGLLACQLFIDRCVGCALRTASMDTPNESGYDKFIDMLSFIFSPASMPA